MYGRIANIPENSIITYKMEIKMNGFRVRFREMSLSLSNKDGGGCLHSFSNLLHLKQLSNCSLYSSKAENSWKTALFDTQPLNHCNDFNASSDLFRDRSQIGVSGIWKFRVFSIVSLNQKRITQKL